MNTLKDRLLNVNFRKTGIMFTVVSFAVIFVLSVAMYMTFHDRVTSAEKQLESLRQEMIAEARESRSTDGAISSGGINSNDPWFNGGYGHDDYYDDDRYDLDDRYDHDDRYDLEDMLGWDDGFRHGQSFIELSTGDKVLIGGAMIAAGLIFAVYWLLITLWITAKAMRCKANPVVWGILTLVFNLGAVVVFFIYRSLRKKCPQCGSIQKHDDEYCADCGAKIVIICSKCGTKGKASAGYCSKCGNPLNEEQEGEAQ